MTNIFYSQHQKICWNSNLPYRFDTQFTQDSHFQNSQSWIFDKNTRKCQYAREDQKHLKYRSLRSVLGFPPEFRVPGSNPEKPGKITIFPGWKTMRKNPEITRKFPGSGFRVPTPFPVAPPVLRSRSGKFGSGSYLDRTAFLIFNIPFFFASSYLK